MVTIIVSDLHLSRHFNRRKFEYLKRVFSQADRVILNGDFWEGFLTTFDGFIKSPWKGLFPILKARETIYIYGNHDHIKKSDHRVNLFSTRQVEYLIIGLGRQKIRIEHGNRLAPALNERLPWLPINRLTFSIVQQFMVHLPLLLFGRRFYIINRSRNAAMKKWAGQNLPADHFLICGHSHLAELSISERYGNTGFIKYRIGQYIKITDDKIELIDENY